MVANLMTQPGETDGMSCLDHVQAVIEHVGPVLDVVLVNGTRSAAARADPALRAQGRLRRPGGPRRADHRWASIPVEADLLKEGSKIRHDSRKVARCLLKMARCGL